MSSKQRTAALAGLLAGAFAAQQAVAQAWPSKPVRFLVGFAPGGSVDLTARILGGPIGEGLGTHVVGRTREDACPGHHSGACRDDEGDDARG